MFSFPLSYWVRRGRVGERGGGGKQERGEEKINTQTAKKYRGGRFLLVNKKRQRLQTSLRQEKAGRGTGSPPPLATTPPYLFIYFGVISQALRPTTDSESRGGGRRRKNSRGPGRPGRRSRRRAGKQERTAVESPSINFHARIIIGKLESWLPDSRFVSPNESERVGAQRRAAAGGGSSFRLYAASSKSSMLRRAIIIVSLASFPPRGRPAGEQIHADRDRGAESRDPLSPSPGRCC